MRVIMIAVMTVALCAATSAQSPADDAHAKFMQRAAEREAARKELVQITVGELEDLRAELQLLKTHNAALTKKIAELTNPSAAKKKYYTQIEMGMTKQELLLFVKARPREMELVAAKLGTKRTTSGVEQTVRVRKESDAEGTAPNKVQVVEESVEHKKDSAVQETMEIALLSARKVVVGQTRDVLGGRHDQVQTQYFRTGKIIVQLTDDVVTGIDARR